MPEFSRFANSNLYMERLMRRENWIKWDINSRLGFKTALFFQEFGAQGYGAFICWVEMLYNAEDHKLPYDDKAIQNYTKLYKLIQTDTKKILDGLCTCGLFEHDDTHFWSPRVNAEVQRGSESSKRLSEIRKAAISTRWANKTAQNDGYKPIQTDTNLYKTYKPIQTCVDKRRIDKKRSLVSNTITVGGMGGEADPVFFDNRKLADENLSAHPKPETAKTKPGKYTTFDRQDFKWPPRWGNKAETAMSEWVAYKASAGHPKLLPSYQKEMEVYSDRPQDFHALVQRAIAQGWQGLNGQLPVTRSGADQPNIGQVKPPKSMVAQIFNSHLKEALKAHENGEEIPRTKTTSDNNQKDFDDVIDITENK